MHPNPSLAEGSLQDAIEALAFRRVELAYRAPTFAEKQATAASDVFSAVGDGIRNHPVLGKALLGGGLGAAVGAGTHALGGDEADPKARRRGILGSALTGGLTGAAVGGGVGAAQKYWPSNFGGSLPGSGAPGPAGGPKLNSGEFMHQGQRFRIDPQVLKDHPDLLRQVNDLSAPPSLAQQGIVGGIKSYLNNDVAPVSSKLLPLVGMGDLAANSERMRLGHRNLVSDPIAGIARRLGKTQTADAVNRWGHQGWGKNLRFGMIDPGRSTNPEHLEAGLEAVRKDSKHLEGLFKGREHALEDLHQNQAKIREHGGAENPNPFQSASRKVSEPERIMLPGQKLDPHGQPYPTGELVSQETGRMLHRTIPGQTLSDLDQQRLKRTGAGMIGESFGKDKSLEGASNRARVQRIGPFGDHAQPTGMFRGGRGLGRVAFYGGLPLAEYAGRSYADDLGKSQDIRELMKQYAKPVPDGG